MTKEEAIYLMHKKMIGAFNQFRETHPDYIPDFSGEEFVNVQLHGINLSGANLQKAKIEGILDRADLSGADLRGADLKGANLYRRRSDGSYNERAILANAKFDTTTKFPAGYDPTMFGATFYSGKEASTSSEVNGVFISYAWVNSEIVLAIDAWLRGKGLRTKLDQRDFFAGSRIQNEIIKVMSSCEAILLFHSHESENKPWVEFERELASDLEVSAKREGRTPPRRIFVVVDDAELPSITETNRIAVFAKGKLFSQVCEEIYHSILQLPRKAENIDIRKWENYVF